MKKDQANNCIKFIKEKYPNIEVLSLKDIISIALEFGEKDAHEHAADYYKLKLEQEQKQKELEASREDYKEEIDEDGRIWYKRTHIFHQRDESRKLKPGDIIQFEARLSGNEGKVNGMMIIDSFDFKSDFAARSYFSFQVCEQYKKADKWEDQGKEKEEPYIAWSHDTTPSINTFSLATEEEIKNFFKEIKETWPKEYEFYFKDFKYKPEYLKERYSQYIN